MNYRHHFHAGNFADVMKHAILLALIAARREPMRLIETHAGAGLYDLHGELARKSAEADGGVGRLMAATDPPAALAALRAAVAQENPAGGVRFYPGSPLLALVALGEGGAYLGFELRPEDCEVLRRNLAQRRHAAGWEVRNDDGYAGAAAAMRAGDLVLVDPPYEQGDEYDHVVEVTGRALAVGAGVAIWAPIKDLETIDALIRRIEALRPASLVVAEVRVRPLANPMAMNGCAMVLVDAPEVTDQAGAICGWVAEHCGEAGAMGRVQHLIP